MMNRFYLSILVLLLTGGTSLGQAYLTQVRGTVIDAVSGQPVPEANVNFTDLGLETITDSMGTFLFPEVPAGRHPLQIVHKSYESRSYEDLLIVSGKELELEVELDYRSVVLSTAGIIAIRDPRLTTLDLFSRTISVEATKRVAAVFFDPARLAPAFPGVIQSDDQANHLVIRGNSPHGVLWRLEGAEIVAPNHTSNAGTATDRPTLSGGGVSMLSTQLLGYSNFSTGSFSSAYGNAISGVFDLNYRPGNTSKREFTVQTGLLGIDLSAEGPFKLGGKASYLINYRYSTVGLLSVLGVPLGDEAISYQDLAFNVRIPGRRAGVLSLFGIYGKSKNEFSGKGIDSLAAIDKERFDILYTGKTQIYGANHRISIGDRSSLNSTLAWSSTNQFRNKAFVLDSTGANVLSSEQDVLNYSILSGNTTFKVETWGNSSFKAGLILSNRSFELTSIYREPGVNTTFNFASLGERTSWLTQVFAEEVFSVGSKMQVRVGGHTLYYGLNNTWSIEPRLSLRYFLNSEMSIKAAAGVHSQLQYPGTYLGTRFEGGTTGGVSYPNLELGFSKARQYGMSYVWHPQSNWTLNLDGYYHDLYNIPIYQDNNRLYSTLNLFDGYVQDSLSNTGKGRNYGVEASLERTLSRNFYLLLSGAKYRAEYAGEDKVWQPGRFDTGYATSMSGGWERSRENQKGRLKTWGLNIRTVLRGGMRMQPIDLVASQLAKRTVFDQTQGFSEQLPAYFRVDFRLVYRIDKPNYTGTLGFDLQNMLNTKNIAYRYYDFVLDQVENRYQLGIIPNLSYRMEF